MAFKMSAYTDMDPFLYGAHTLQCLLIFLFNRAQFAKLNITKQIKELSTRSPSTPEALMSLIMEFNGLHGLGSRTHPCLGSR